jgi:hypothetical protein
MIDERGLDMPVEGCGVLGPSPVSDAWPVGPTEAVEEALRQLIEREPVVPREDCGIVAKVQPWEVEPVAGVHVHHGNGRFNYHGRREYGLNHAAVWCEEM